MRRILFKNAKLVLSDRIAQQGSLMVEGDRIAAVWEENVQSPAPAETIDLQGLYLAPGFIDIHVHGGGGGDFMDGTEDSWTRALQTHLIHGTTSLCPTTLTASDEEIDQVFARYRLFEKEDAPSMPRLLGLHMEGPFIAESMKGAQNAAYIRSPNQETADLLMKKGSGALRILTAAPELEGASILAAAAQKAGVLLSVGHSDGRLEDVEAAVAQGYTMATHLYSSMSTITRENGMRIPGVLEAALLLDALDAEVIADGMHLPAALLQLVVKTKGIDHVILVTDAMRGAGLAPGHYKLGSLRDGQTVWSDGTIARMPDGVSFAGSVATADRLIRVMHEDVGVTLWQAVNMMTRNPAKALGEREIGILEPGKKADLVCFDEHVRIRRVYRDGIAVPL